MDLAIDELGWRVLLKAKFIGKQARRLLGLEISSTQESRETTKKIEKSHGCHDENEAALIQCAHKQYSSEN